MVRPCFQEMGESLHLPRAIAAEVFWLGLRAFYGVHDMLIHDDVPR